MTAIETQIFAISDQISLKTGLRGLEIIYAWKLSEMLWGRRLWWTSNHSGKRPIYVLPVNLKHVLNGGETVLFWNNLLQARDMKVIGDLQKAKEYSTWALGLNVAALITITVISISLVIFLIVRAVQMDNYYVDHYNNPPYRDQYNNRNYG